MTIIKLKKGKDKKIINSYPWIFKDEIYEIIQSEDDTICNVFSYDNKFLGKAFLNVGSNKYLYMITTKDERIGFEFFKRKITEAYALRKLYYDKPYYRLINAESDFLPGLIIDRYGEYFSIQIRLNGMERYKSDIVKILRELFEAKGVFERSDFESLKSENLSRNFGILYGEVPKEIEIEENGIKYLVDIKNGQKTGFFFDQKESRAFLQKVLKGKRYGLDLYTYTGSFALNMAKMGLNVDAVDKSKTDIELAKKNAKINNLTINFIVDDAIEYIRNTKNNYDIIILDPPSLIKNKNQIKWVKNFLKDLIRYSLNRINDRGILSFCSCAYYIDWKIMTEVLRISAGDLGIKLRVINKTIQSYDHPWILQIPETLYLKCFWLEVYK